MPKLFWSKFCAILNFVWVLEAIIYITINAIYLYINTGAIGLCEDKYRLWECNLALTCYLGIKAIFLHVMSRMYCNYDETTFKLQYGEELGCFLILSIFGCMIGAFVMSYSLGISECPAYASDYPDLLTASQGIAINEFISMLIIILNVMVWKKSERDIEPLAQEIELNVIPRYYDDAIRVNIS